MKEDDKNTTFSHPKVNQWSDIKLCGHPYR